MTVDSATAHAGSLSTPSSVMAAPFVERAQMASVRFVCACADAAHAIAATSSSAAVSRTLMVQPPAMRMMGRQGCRGAWDASLPA